MENEEICEEKNYYELKNKCILQFLDLLYISPFCEEYKERENKLMRNLTSLLKLID